MSINIVEFISNILDILSTSEVEDDISIGILSVMLPQWAKDSLPDITWHQEGKVKYYDEVINFDNGKSYKFGSGKYQEYPYSNSDSKLYICPITDIKVLEKWLYEAPTLPILDQVPKPSQAAKYNLGM